MDSDNSLIYGLEFQARALSSQTAETETIRFFIGTQSLKQVNNQVHLVELGDNDSTLKTKVFKHPFGEIWKLTASPHDTDVIATCYNSLNENNECRMKTALLKIPMTINDSIETQSLELITELKTEKYGTDIKTTEFNVVQKNRCATVIDNNIVIYDLETFDEVQAVSYEAKNNPKFMTGKWYPHQNSTQFVAVVESSVLCYDVRIGDNVPVWRLDANPGSGCLLRDVDMNINVQALVATAGDDACVRLWDARNPTESLSTRRDHSHWVWCVRFNTFHDQLLLSSSSDSRVLLSSVLSYSSEAGGPGVLSDADESDADKKQKVADGPLQWLEQHEDSVYCVEWSAADPWTFASLSYDGRLVVSRVPRVHKYRILL